MSVSTASSRVADVISLESPMKVSSPKECAWYQTFDWPDGTVVRGRWDYRHDVDGYLGRIDYSGKSVIELGPASGFLTRAMEKRGADVTCIDTGVDAPWDVVPRLDRDTDAYIAARTRGLPSLRKSWWLTRETFDGTAKMSLCGAGALFDVKDKMRFDIGFVGSILQHFESPYRVLSSLATMCETIVVSEMRMPRLEVPGRNLAEFLPATQNNNLGSWWLLSSSTVRQMMATLGFVESASHATTYRRYALKHPDVAQDPFTDHEFYTIVFKKAAVDAEAFSRIDEA